MSPGAPRSALVVAPSPVPLRTGGAERHWEGIRRALDDAGVAVDLVKLPVREDSLSDLVDAYEAFRLLDVSQAEMVITGKYPAWMVQHPRHVVWMLHPLRGLYDTWSPAHHEAEDPSGHPELADLLTALDSGVHRTGPLELIDLVREAHERLGPAAAAPGGPLAFPGTVARRVVHHLDHWALDRRRVGRHMAISSEVAERAGYFPPGITAEVLVPPSCLEDPDPTEPGPAARFLVVGRLEPPKRVDLAIRAFALVKDPAARLTIAGDGSERTRLESLAAADDRVDFVGRVPDRELAELYRNARAVIVSPEAEDFGYVTIEAFQAGRPVITTNDSGGPAELLTDGSDGVVTEPDPAALARAIEALDEETARRMGAGARTTAARHSWPAAARTLLEPPPRRRSRPGRRGRVVALSTYPVDRWPGGGPERARHLLGALSDAGWEVDLVAISPDSNGGTSELGDGFTEVRAPLSNRHLEADRRLRRLTANVAVSDITSSVLWPASGELVGAAEGALHGAAAVIAVQPYLAPMALRLAPGLPLVYDAHNHERRLKAAMLPDDEAGHWMLQRVVAAETAAVRAAGMVVASAIEDARSLEAEHSLERGTVLVVPNGVDTASTRPATPEVRAGARRDLFERHAPGDAADSVALFVGSAHRPNVDAAHEILLLAPRHPTTLFMLAGEHSDMLDVRHVPPNVVCLGRVGAEHLEQLHAAADVALNPMRSGSGSNLKVLEYLAAGIPVVSTEIGVRGLPDAHEYATVARIDGFEAALVETLSGSRGDRDSGELARRARDAREMVERTHDWTVVAKGFTEAFTHLLAPEVHR